MCLYLVLHTYYPLSWKQLQWEVRRSSVCLHFKTPQENSLITSFELIIRAGSHMTLCCHTQWQQWLLKTQTCKQKKKKSKRLSRVTNFRDIICCFHDQISSQNVSEPTEGRDQTASKGRSLVLEREDVQQSVSPLWRQRLKSQQQYASKWASTRLSGDTAGKTTPREAWFRGRRISFSRNVQFTW